MNIYFFQKGNGMLRLITFIGMTGKAIIASLEYIYGVSYF